jgi:hypothetical protein
VQESNRDERSSNYREPSENGAADKTIAPHDSGMACDNAPVTRDGEIIADYSVGTAGNANRKVAAG